MTSDEVERTIVDLIQREPFAPFVVDLNDGRVLEVTHPRLAINGGGAGYLGPDGGLVDFEFKAVRSIRLMEIGAVA